jgi:hypothetical protein
VAALVADDVGPQALENVLHPIEGLTIHKGVEAGNVLTLPRLDVEQPDVDGISKSLRKVSGIPWHQTES